MAINCFTQNYADYKYICNYCDFKSNKNNDYDRHLNTAKHKRLTTANNLRPIYAKTINQFTCECGKSYKHQSSLCKHKKNCLTENIIKDINPQAKLSDVSDKDNLIMMLIKENSEFKTIFFFLSEKLGYCSKRQKRKMINLLEKNWPPYHKAAFD